MSRGVKIVAFSEVDRLHWPVARAALGAQTGGWEGNVTASVPRKHVLVVDDDRQLLRLLDHWLRDAGYDVVTCDRFEDARKLLEGPSPFALVIDVRLGAFNGLQLVFLAKSQNPQTLAIVMTAFDDPTLRNEATRCGARYLLKPFTGEQMLALLAQTPPPTSLEALGADS